MKSKKYFDCVNNTIRLRSGRYFDLADPQPDQFEFSDIAGALSKICRFGGQIEHYYSVAEHCWHCAEQARKDGLPLETQVALLMHDAAEAFCGDMVKPLKIMMPGYAEVEARIESAIAERFQIDFRREEFLVRKIDHEILIAERRYLFSRDDVEWIGEREVRKIDVDFWCWSPGTAEAQFTSLARFIGIKANQ